MQQGQDDHLGGSSDGRRGRVSGNLISSFRKLGKNRSLRLRAFACGMAPGDERHEKIKVWKRKFDRKVELGLRRRCKVWKTRFDRKVGPCLRRWIADIRKLLATRARRVEENIKAEMPSQGVTELGGGSSELPDVTNDLLLDRLADDSWKSSAVVKKSMDPYKDFRDSMVEIIGLKDLREDHELEDLLRCYLSLNSARFHTLIVEAFIEVCPAPSDF